MERAKMSHPDGERQRPLHRVGRAQRRVKPMRGASKIASGVHDDRAGGWSA